MKVDLEYKNESNNKDNSEIEVFHKDGDVEVDGVEVDSEAPTDDVSS